MIKKKLNILLLLLLVLLFTSLLGNTCYAREVDKYDLQNFCLNSYIEYYGETHDTTNFENFLTTNESSFDNIATILNQYEGYYAISRVGYSVAFWYITGSQNNLNNHHPWYRQEGYNYITINSSYLTRHKLTMDFRDGFYKINTSWTNGDLSLPQTGRNFYTDINIYSASNYQSVLFPAGTLIPDGVFSGPFGVSTSYFDFIINNDVVAGTAKIYGDTSMTDYYLIPFQSGSFRLGSFYDLENLAGVVKSKYRYSQANRDFTLINEYQSNIDDTNFYLHDDEFLQVYEYYQPDTTEFIFFTPSGDYQQIVVPIYYTTKNTNIVGGYINLDNTFSGDYYNNYNNDTNTDKIIDNINNDDDVDSTLNEFISGDAEQIANKFGFTLFTMEYYDFIYHTVTEIVDVLTESGDVYFDYSMHGETPTRIYSSSFTTPNGALKTFLQMFLISCTIYAFYKYIADLLELISTGNILEALNEFAVDRNIFKM